MTKEKEFRVVVGVPSMTTWHAEFAMSLIGLVGYFANTQVPGARVQQLQVCNKRGSILPNLRLQCLKAARAANATHLLWLDSDHKFPPNLLNRLLEREKDVVALNCATKTMPTMPTARGFNPADRKGDAVYTDVDSTGLERVWRVGTGVMLMTARAFNQIPNDAFSMRYEASSDSYVGEDWSMCEELEKVGCPIYIDHPLSYECGHIGTFEYTHEYCIDVQRVPEEVKE